jgi:undecaprenyl-diphosphatase
VIVPAAFGWDSPSLVFDSTVHLATLIAVIAVFWHDIVKIIRAWFLGIYNRRPLESVNSRLGWWVILATIPGVLAGIFLEDTFSSFFHSPRAAGGFLLLTAVLLVIAEVAGRRRRNLEAITWLDSLLMGIGQAAAISPGLSRSGTTISVGMYCGLSREAAARFSFILSIPIIAGAGLVQLTDLIRQGGLSAEAPLLVVGFFSAAVSGYIAIRFFMSYLRKRPLYPFSVYCVIVGVLAIVLL